MNILYTEHLRGDLRLLPRLATFLRRLRTADTFLIDLGASCTPEVWPCGITGGRAVLVVLDAIGYDAANVSGFLTAEGRQKLKENYLRMVLVDEQTPHTTETFAFGPTPDAPLTISQQSAPQMSWISDKHLTLQTLTAGQVGQVRFEDGTPQTTIHQIDANTPPDATISGVVDFVISEAAYFEKRSN